MPGTDDSKVGLTTGMSTPRLALPNTKVIAPTGQATLQAPWPMQSVGLIRVAFPRMMPRTWCNGSSGHAFTQAEQPMQVLTSMTGCREAGSVTPESRDC